MPRNDSSRQAGKRPMRALTPIEKFNAIERVHGGESKAAVARDIGVPESTLRGWCKSEHKIRMQMENMKNSGTYDPALTTSSSDNSDNSRPGSSSRSTPTTQQSATFATPIGTTPITRDRTLEDMEIGQAAKRIKLESLPNVSPMMNNISMSPIASQSVGLNADTMLQTYLQLLATNPDLMDLFIKGQYSNSILPSTVTSSGYPPSILRDLHRNGILTNITMPNMMPTSSVVNGKRKYSAPVVSSMSTVLPKVSSKRQSSQSPIAEKPYGNSSQSTNNQTSIPSIPSTSADNGHAGGATVLPKSPKDCKKLDAIICQLQQGSGSNVCNSPGDDAASNNSNVNINSNVNNNNNVDHVNNETRNSSPNSLPPGFSETLSCCTKLLQWLDRYGSAICTFQQVTQVRTILDNLTNWANSKESEPKNKSNNAS
ncbi:hypothetical protein P5V15_004151 [Pogonomyrmex californicus]